MEVLKLYKPSFSAEMLSILFSRIQLCQYFFYTTTLSWCSLEHDNLQCDSKVVKTYFYNSHCLKSAVPKCRQNVRPLNQALASVSYQLLLNFRAILSCSWGAPALLKADFYGA